MNRRTVSLIGFMGAGKTAVGRALAERLGYRLYDTDEMVVEEAGMSVPQIWEQEGERGFRTRESVAVVRACAHPGGVVACGGGAVLRMRNYGVLKGAGPIVYLRAPAAVLRERVGDGMGRPLLADPGAFEKLLVERVPVYESAADLIVDVDGRTADEIATEIAERLP